MKTLVILLAYMAYLFSQNAHACVPTPKLAYTKTEMNELLAIVSNANAMPSLLKDYRRYSVFGRRYPYMFTVEYMPHRIGDIEYYNHVHCKLGAKQIWACNSTEKRSITLPGMDSYVIASDNISAAMAIEVVEFLIEALNKQLRPSDLGLPLTRDDLAKSMIIRKRGHVRSQDREIEISYYKGGCSFHYIKIRRSNCENNQCQYTLLENSDKWQP